MKPLHKTQGSLSHEAEGRKTGSFLAIAAPRFVQLLVVLFLASVGVFSLVRIIPGDPAAVIAGLDAPDQVVEAIRVRLGLDQPMFTQYFNWMRGILQGDFGESFVTNTPVSELLVSRLPDTVMLAVGGMIVTIVIGFVGGVTAGLFSGGLIDRIISAFNVLFISVPTFWSGLLLLLVFGLFLGLLPLGGYVSSTLESPGEAIRHLILPSITLGLALGPELAWFVRNGILDARARDFVRTAYAKGISRWRVTMAHILKNGLLPVLTVLGIQLGRLLSGAVVVEAVFTWPGLGSLAISSISARDYPTVQAVVLVFVVMFVLANFITDLLYPIVDPRVRTG